MLLIETKSERELKILEEEFCRDGNYFAIPLKKAHQIQDFLDSILFQMFEQEDYIQMKKKNLKQVVDQKLNSLPVLKKIKQLVCLALKMTISLSTLRQIFEIIKQQEDSIKNFQNYFLDIDSLLEQQNSLCLRNQLEKISFLQNAKFQEEDQINKKSGIICLESETYCSQILQEIKNQKKILQHNLNSLSQIQGNQEKFTKQNLDSSNSQKKTRLSLKCQMSTQFEQNIHQIFQTKLHDSFSSNNDSINQIQNVKEEIAYDRSTNATLYTPSWKNIEDQRKKVIEKVLGKQICNKKDINDEFLKNLSGKFTPTPSILNDQSFEKLARQQKKEDIRKSVIFKDQILGSSEILVSETNQKLYNYNIKTIKLQSKLKGKKSPSKSPNFRKRKTSNGQEVLYDFQMKKSHIEFSQVHKKEKQSQKKRISSEKNKGSLLSSIFKFKKAEKQIKIEKEREKKILACFIE